jgi:hypothetical protein
MTVHGDQLEIRERSPLARPLRLERGRSHDHGSPDLPRCEQRMARCDRLRGLSEPHVIGEQEPTDAEEPLDSVALVPKQLLLDSAQQLVELASTDLPSASKCGVLTLELRQERGFRQYRVAMARRDQELHGCGTPLLADPHRIDRPRPRRRLKHRGQLAR